MALTANGAICLLNKRGCRMVYNIGGSGFDVVDSQILLSVYFGEFSSSVVVVGAGFIDGIIIALANGIRNGLVV